MFKLTRLSICLFFPPLILSVLVSGLDCPYPSANLIKPCYCKMQAEYHPGNGGKNVLLSSFAKTLRCRAPFTHIGESFDYDNRIASLEIYGTHDGKYFLTKDDLGRLNVTSLQLKQITLLISSCLSQEYFRALKVLCNT